MLVVQKRNWNPEGCVKDFRATSNWQFEGERNFLIEPNNDVENAIKSSGEEKENSQLSTMRRKSRARRKRWKGNKKLCEGNKIASLLKANGWGGVEIEVEKHLKLKIYEWMRK